jgi:C-terminal processing protease CtpA/Prc
VKLDRRDDGVYVFTLRTMVEPDPSFFDELLDKLFSELRQRDARGLVVDLRSNVGGSTGVGERLLRRIARVPFRIFGAKSWRVSAPMQAQLRNEGASGAAYIEASIDDMLTRSAKLIEPAPAHERYHGPVVFLIGPRTRSAAMMTANAVQDFDLALIVGEPTSSPPNYFGETYLYEMKHSGLRVSISTAVFVRANGDDEDRDVVRPDIDVPAATTAMQDEALSTALHAIELWQATHSSDDRAVVTRAP